MVLLATVQLSVFVELVFGAHCSDVGEVCHLCQRKSWTFNERSSGDSAIDQAFSVTPRRSSHTPSQLVRNFGCARSDFDRAKSAALIER